MLAERPDLKPYQGRELTVIAWLWARTVNSPNPAFAEVAVPLASTFMLSTKSGKEAYVEPVIENGGYRFSVKVGKPKDPVAARAGTKLARGANFRCLMSGMPIASDHIYGEAQAGHMTARLLAIVAEGDRGRVYLAPTAEHEAAAREAKPEWKPDVAMPENPRWFSPPLYGLTTYGDLFTPRQLTTLTTFSDLVGEAMARIRADARAAGDYGVAETLSKAKNTSVQGLVEAGILSSQAGQVRLLQPDELPADWNPETDPRLTVWEMAHHLICVLEAGASAPQQSWSKNSAPGQNRCVSYAIAYIRCASAKNAPPKRSPTTAWCKAGPRLSAWRKNRPGTASKARCLMRGRIDRCDRLPPPDGVCRSKTYRHRDQRQDDVIGRSRLNR